MSDAILRAARTGDGAALFKVTASSVQGLAGAHYSAAQRDGWMGARSAASYEAMIAKGNVTVAERAGAEGAGEILGFVDACAGEVTRLFILPGAAGQGLGAKLLAIGMERAKAHHTGPIRVESTLNAESFYARHGFLRQGLGHFSHGEGGDPIAVVFMEHPGPRPPV